MPDAVETYAGTVVPWWLNTSPTAKHAEILDGTRTSAEMRQAAGLLWSVSKRPLVYPTWGSPNEARTAPRYMAQARDTDDAFYGIVKDTYHTFQNSEAFETMDVILAQAAAGDEGVQYETAGSLFGGAMCWALAKFDKELHVRGDGSALTDYLLGWWGHDGRHGFGLGNTMVRVVCANTLSAGRKGSTDKIVLRHTANMGSRVEEARRALDIHAKYREELVATLNDLTRRPMTLDEVLAFTVELLPSNPEVERAIRTEAERDEIVSIFKTSDLLDGLGFTAYRTYNAVTEYLDHHKDVRETKAGGALDRKAVSIVEGPVYDLKTRALSLLLKA